MRDGIRNKMAELWCVNKTKLAVTPNLNLRPVTPHVTPVKFVKKEFASMKASQMSQQMRSAKQTLTVATTKHVTKTVNA